MTNYEKLAAKAAEFLKLNTADFITRGESFTEHYSLEEMMAIIQGRAIDADDAECERFLNEEVPWEDLEIPDPRGWANQG
jgi:hypothetical protein